VRGAQAGLRPVRGLREDDTPKPPKPTKAAKAAKPVKAAKPPKPVKPPKEAERALSTRKLLAAARGARLCYGEPVEAGARTVIPVARVRAAGGHGQRGGGGRLDAEPVGFIEVTAQGARFEPIAAPAGAARTLAAGGAALTGLLATVVLRRRRRARLRPSPLRRSLPR
jgi:hypothetical protein